MGVSDNSENTVDRRRFLALLVTGGTALALGACASPPAAQPVKATEPPKSATQAPDAKPGASTPAPAKPADTTAPAVKGTVTVVFWGHNNTRYTDAYKANIAAFEKKNPNIKIDYQIKPGTEYAQLVLTAMAANNTPDVFRVGDWQILEYVRDKAVRPLDLAAFEAKDAKEAMAKWLGPTFPAKFVIDNAIYAVPEDIATLLLLANLDILNEVGIDKFPDTADKMVEAAKKGTKSEGGRWTRSGFEWYYNHELWETIEFSHLIRTFGGAICDQNAKVVLDQGDAALKALTYYYDTIFTWKVANPAFGVTFGQPTPTHFETGNSVLHPANSSKIVAIKNAAKVKKWEAGLWRTGPQDNVLAWAWSLGLSATSKAPLEASKWIAFLQSPEAAAVMMKTAGTMPAVKDAENYDYVKQTPELQPYAKLGAQAKYMDPFPHYPKVSKAIAKMMQATAQSGVKPADALATCVKELKAI
ncbi:MAG: extracellular solute-binding protein [Chloroflexota bacterium]